MVPQHCLLGTSHADIGGRIEAYGHHCSRDVPRGMGKAHSDRRAVQAEAQSHSLCFGFARWREARHIGDAVDVSDTHLCGRWKVR